jgi:hypothetical protein
MSAIDLVAEFHTVITDHLCDEGFDYDDEHDLESYYHSEYQLLVAALDKNKITAGNLAKVQEALVSCYSHEDRVDEKAYKRNITKEIKMLLTNLLEDNDVKITGSTSKGSKTMNTVKNVAKKVAKAALDDSKTVAVRLAAKKLPQLLCEPFVQLLVERIGLPADSSMKGKVRAFLESDIGTACLSMMLSAGVDFLPIPDIAKESVAELAREMRLSAMTTVAEPAVEMLMLPARDILTNALMQVKLPGLAASTNLQTPLLTEQTTAQTTVSIKTPPKKAAKKTTKKPSKKPDSGITVKEKVAA